MKVLELYLIVCTVTDSPIVSLRRGKVEKKKPTSTKMPRTPNGNPPQVTPRRVAKKSTGQPQFIPQRHATPLDVPNARAAQPQQAPASRTRSQVTDRPTPAPARSQAIATPAPARSQAIAAKRLRLRDPQQQQRSPQRRRRRYRYVFLKKLAYFYCLLVQCVFIS